VCTSTTLPRWTTSITRRARSLPMKWTGSHKTARIKGSLLPCSRWSPQSQVNTTSKTTRSGKKCMPDSRHRLGIPYWEVSHSQSQMLMEFVTTFNNLSSCTILSMSAYNR
jgi:hypothetical protein